MGIAFEPSNNVAAGIIVRRQDLDVAIGKIVRATVGLELGRITTESAVPELREAIKLLNNLATKQTGSAVN